MSTQRAGRQKRVEGVEDPLILAAVRCMLDHRAGEALTIELAPQQCGQETTQAVGLERDRRQEMILGKPRDLAAELGRLVDLADQGRLVGQVRTPWSQ